MLVLFFWKGAVSKLGRDEARNLHGTKGREKSETKKDRKKSEKERTKHSTAIWSRTDYRIEGRRGCKVCFAGMCVSCLCSVSVFAVVPVCGWTLAVELGVKTCKERGEG